MEYVSNAHHNAQCAQMLPTVRIVQKDGFWIMVYVYRYVLWELMQINCTDSTVNCLQC